MKISIKKSMLMVCGALTLTLSTTSCEDFLDRQDDENLTFSGIWEKYDYTKRYWLNAMSFLPDDAGQFNYSPWMGASDEGSVTYDRASYRYINFGTWTPTASGWNTLTEYYQGIRECNILMQNVDKCTDPKATKEELNNWKVYSRWARAYYYFLMMRQFGPVFLLGDDLVDFTATTEALYRPRNTWEQCVSYVVSEMEECAKQLPDTWLSDAEKGLPTKGACYAVISRLKLYSARDLFNGNKDYASVVNPQTPDYPDCSGQVLFPQTYDANKWKEAADAALRVLNMGTYELYRADGNNPYANWRGLLTEHWNKEIIWSTGYASAYTMGVHCAPTGLSGTAYGGVGPTQQQVDAYAMSNGRYPITGYEKDGTPVIDSESGYTEDGKEMFDNPYVTWLINQTSSRYASINGGFPNYAPASSGYVWPTMYKNREPRFYMTVFWSDSYWIHGTNAGDGTLISFAKNGNSNKSHDYPKSGYILNRFYNHTLNSTSGSWGNIVFPTFRLAEIYLNFIEAALECESRGVTSEYHNKAMELWADLRDRVGLDPITDSYPSATTKDLIELCRKERRVELAFENHRFFDTRTWKIAESTDGGAMYGMNTDAIPSNKDNTPEDFWKRTVFETRVFKSNHYLYPFSQRELDRNKQLTQNYGW